MNKKSIKSSSINTEYSYLKLTKSNCFTWRNLYNVKSINTNSRTSKSMNTRISVTEKKKNRNKGFRFMDVGSKSFWIRGPWAPKLQVKCSWAYGFWIQGFIGFWAYELEVYGLRVYEYELSVWICWCMFGFWIREFIIFGLRDFGLVGM